MESFWLSCTLLILVSLIFVDCLGCLLHSILRSFVILFGPSMKLVVLSVDLELVITTPDLELPPIREKKSRLKQEDQLGDCPDNFCGIH